MTTAREEAEKRYPIDVYVLPVRDEQLARANAVRRLAFITGAEWQAKQPVEITDEMVKRAARAAYEWWAENSTSVRLGDSAPAEWDDLDQTDRAPIIAQARAVFEAALGEGWS